MSGSKTIRIILQLFTLMVLHSCSAESTFEMLPVELTMVPVSLQTKGNDPDENLINDLNLFIFNEEGQLEDSKYLSSREIGRNGGKVSVTVSLARGRKTRIACCANYGFKIEGIGSFKELSAFRFSLAYPDEYSRGMPMSGNMFGIWTTNDKEITVPLERMMSKISVSLDRSALDDDVRISVKSMTICNSPRSTSVFGHSSAAGSSDVFRRGLSKSYAAADDLNIEASPGVSREVCLYLLENMRGDLLDDTTDDSGKVLPSAISQSCSYMELEMEYLSDTWQTKPDEYLKYRFYLGESNFNFDVERNCHYHYSIQPYGSGLTEDNWRIDKSSLTRRQ